MKIKTIRLDDYGRAVATIDGKITFIKYALDEELVEYKIIKEKKKFNEGELINIINKSPNRVKEDCPYYYSCGGCHLRHMKYDYEKEFKINKVKNLFLKNANIKIDEIELISDLEYNYRNKVTLTIDKDKLGLLKEKTNEIVEIDKCLILDNKINEIIVKLKELIKNENISKIVIKLGNKTNEIMLDITGDIKNREKFINISDSLYLNNKCITNPYINSYICNKVFHIRNNSFFQVNSNITERLYNEILANINELNAKNILDLYCGVGTIGIFISDYVDKILGVEVVESAIVDAEENKKINNINNIEFINSRVEDLDIDFNLYDTIILDPPRSGCDKNTIKTIISKNIKNIIYVSCDPNTLTRDLNILKDYYNIKKVKLFNMFPRTYHCESVCVLERR